MMRDYRLSGARRAGLTALAITVSGPALAQQTAATSQSDAAINQPATDPQGGIGDIVVTARRSNESAQKVPIAITTVTSQKLQDLNTRDIIDIQKVTPGLYMSSQNTGGRVKLTIRGQSEADSRLTTDGSVAVYIDGVPYVRNYGLRTSFTDIAQVEVLKGPQGTLFGKNSTGGALNITTEHPKYEWGGYADLSLGSYYNAQALAVINAPVIADRLAVRLVGQVISRDGFGRGGNGQDVGDDRAISGRLLVRADPSDNLHILLSADGARQNQNGSNVILTADYMLQNANTATGSLGEIAKELGLNPTSPADRATAYAAWRRYYDLYQKNIYNGYGTNASNDRLKDYISNFGFSGTVSLDVGPVTLKSITAYRGLYKYTHPDTDATPFTIVDGLVTTHQRNFSQELQASAIDGVGLDWQVGAFYNRETGNEFASQNNFSYINALRSAVTDLDVVNKSTAIYAQSVFNFSDQLRATGGIRYTWDSRAIDSHNRIDPLFEAPPILPGGVARCNLLSPALGGPTYPNCSYKVSVSSHKPTWLASVDWRPVPSAMLYGSVSTGYRSGGFTYNGSSSVQNSLASLTAAYAPFQPESVTNYEVGFKSEFFDHKLRVNGAAYYQDYKDIQKLVRDFVNGILVSIIRNAAKAKLYGGELEVTAAPTQGLLLNGGVSYLHAAYGDYRALDGTGNVLDLTAQPFSAPKWTYNLGATYTMPVDGGNVRANVNYAHTSAVNSSPGQPGVPLNVYDPASVTIKPYGLLDARLAWHIDAQGLDIAVFGKNLTDKHYLNAASSAQSLGFNIGYPGDPRTLGVQVRKTF